MNSKVLLGGVIGALVFFLMGWLLYGLLMDDVILKYANVNCTGTEDVTQIVYILIGDIILGILLAWIYSKWATVHTFSTGLSMGAMIGLMISLGTGFIMFGTTSMYTEITGVFVSAAIDTVLWAITGGVMGWWMGRK